MDSHAKANQHVVSPLSVERGTVETPYAGLSGIRAVRHGLASELR